MVNWDTRTGQAGRKSSHIRCETTSNTPGIQTARLFQNGPTVSPICPSARRPTTPTPQIRRKAETLDRSDVTSERGGLRYVTHDTNEQQEEISTEERGEGGTARAAKRARRSPAGEGWGPSEGRIRRREAQMRPGVGPTSTIVILLASVGRFWDQMTVRVGWPPKREREGGHGSYCRSRKDSWIELRIRHRR